jgi:hypothetical protein
LVAPVFAQNPPHAPAPSIVYTAHDPSAIKQYHTNASAVRSMVDRLVMAVASQPDIAKAWASLVSPNDKIGIKISAAGGELFTTHRDIVNAIVGGLVAAGHPRGSIVVWDRSLDGIDDAGYKPGAEGYRMVSIAPRAGYDPTATFSAPVMGKLIWGDFEYKSDKGAMPLASIENTSNISHFARILSSEVTKVINVPVMSDSAGNGLAGCLYNMTLPNIDNWRRFSQPPGVGAPAIVELYSNPLIEKKVVLNIMDGLLAEYAGGPESEPNFSTHYATIMASKDPVAIDSIALKRIEEWRKDARFPPIAPIALHVQYAAQIGIGNADRARIEVKNVGR